MLIFAFVGIAGAVLSAWLGEETAGRPLEQEAAAVGGHPSPASTPETVE